MNYGQVKRASLELIFSESIAGQPIELTYNNQEDYVRAIPKLVDACQQMVATSNKRIPALVKLGELEKTTNGFMDVYTLPSDCWQIMAGGLIDVRERRYRPEVSDRVHDFKVYGGNKLFIASGSEDLFLEYYRYPHSVGDDPDDNVELDNTPEVHAIIPYYVGAHLVQYDDSFRYAALYNEFQTKYANLNESIMVEDSRINDAYGFFAGSY